jgi:hypothetical protein
LPQSEKAFIFFLNQVALPLLVFIKKNTSLALVGWLFLGLKFNHLVPGIFKE